MSQRSVAGEVKTLPYYLVSAILIFSWSVDCRAATRNSDQGKKSSGKYLFPTNASRQINSGFADYRASHFHGGIDISTNDRIGYPVYAAKSGYVYRISVSPFGYGKMIILRHDDSTYTLYGHLSGFAPEIQRLVDSLQRVDSSYDVNLRLRPGEISVNRGEVIARTGATGVGGPHLHFEIHDKDYSFVDPLVYKSLDVPRYRNPKIFGIIVRGYSSGKTVVRHPGRTKRDAHNLRAFRFDEPFYFIIHAADSYGRGRFKRPPKHIYLRIDEKDFISVNLTKFSYDDYLDVRSLVDVKLSHGYETYYRLCVDRAIPFSIFSPSAPLSGIVGGNLLNGIHSYELTVKDENGDSTFVSGKFDLEIPRHKTPKGFADSDQLRPIPRFDEETLAPIPGLTLKFPGDCFARNINLKVVPLSSSSFKVDPDKEPIRKGIRVNWKVSDPKLQLYRKGRKSWIHISSRNNGHNLTAHITFETGTFALLLDDMPPVVGPLRTSSSNPFYKSVAPKQFNILFVYFRVFDRMSGINTDRIFLKIGGQDYLCEYDADMHSAICRVNRGILKVPTKVQAIVSDNAGNITRVNSMLKFRR